MASLPIKYRPKEFNDVTQQGAIVKILEKQLETGEFKNCYLFSGPSGCGKTTIARIMAYKINSYRDSAGNLCSAEPIEIDAASNNSVDNVRVIADAANQRSLDGKYKIYIIDECHMLTTQAWNALLKTIEETPKFTIFMFCTTEYNKVPATIQNRCQQYFLTRISDEGLVNRLRFICDKENILYTEDSLKHIAKLAQGSMRQAIAYLEKCRDYSNNITVDAVLLVLGDSSYDTCFKLINAIIDKRNDAILNVIEKLYNDGTDLKMFLDTFINFVLDLSKYCIFRSYDIINIAPTYKEELEYTINVEGATRYFNHVLNKLLNIKTISKGDSNFKTTLEISLMNI